MWMIAGLGNPGTKYNLTRHNVGFMAADVLNESLDRSKWSQQSKAEIIKTKLRDENILLVKPQTFMNLSGDAVQALMHFYKIERSKLIVLHDEIEIKFGEIRIHKNRGHGGHNGVRDISAKLASPDYIRVRIGVGRPENPHIPVADYVLGPFSSEEMQKLPDFLNRVGDAIECIITEGHEKAATRFNK